MQPPGPAFVTPASGPTRLVVAAALVVLALVSAACSGGSEAATDSRPRPTDTGLHDHGDDSALAPETVSAAEIAQLGDGVGPGERFEGFLGINICGRFLEIPDVAPRGGVSVQAGGRMSIAPTGEDEVGLDVTVQDLLAPLGVTLGTGTVAFGSQWAGSTTALGGEDVPVDGLELATGESCGREQGEVQLWYYTEEAVDSGDEIRIVVTDPQI
ncbi:MAG: hypothetical protein R2716_06330 [Microthrixaceae bacterium]